MNGVMVKYFAVIMTSETGLLPEILKRLKKYFGDADLVSGWFPFTYTDFYEPEMGKGLQRCIVSFARLMPPQALPDAKKLAAKVENRFRTKGKRRVNIDAGYLDHCKVVLASGKFGGHKIALTDKCYADMILDYRKGAFHPFPWCFPDFRSGIYDEILLRIRGSLRS